MNPRSETPEELRNLLTPRKHLEMEEVSFSDSEISDAFEEFHLQSFLHHVKGEKALSKAEADRLTMEHFTDIFKETMTEVRKELNLGSSIMYESIEDIQKVLNTPRKGEELSKEVLERIETILKDENNIYNTTELSERCDDDGNVILPISDVWNAARSNNCSEANSSTLKLDEFQENLIHGPEISREILDASRSKCEKWLNEQ